MQNQIVKIKNDSYEIVDSIQDLKAEDSFFLLKLQETTGNGEARKYVGNYNKKDDVLTNFFDYTRWGKERKQETTKLNSSNSIQEERCFFSKSNFQMYLSDARDEFYAQEQVYRKNIKPLYSNILSQINNLENEVNFFSIYDVSDKANAKGSLRAYIRSDDPIWKLWRSFVLPRISSLSILKLQKINSSDNAPYFYFRIFLDYDFRPINHPKHSSIILNEPKEKEVERQKEYSKVKPNLRNEKFRKGVLDHMPLCPFTSVSDDRILRASHIKPHMVCINEANLEEAYDKLNGLTLTHTYDHLFDKGFITFLDDGTLICGTRLSRLTWSKLKVNTSNRTKFNIMPKGREKYLEYHRKYVFQDNVEELIRDDI